MKNFFGFILIFFIFGCSNKYEVPQISLRTSEPIFLNEKPKNDKIFINVADERGENLDLKAFFEKKFLNLDYKLAKTEELAGINIKIYISNLNQKIQKEFFIDPFDCMPFWGCRYDPMNYRTSYFYDGEASLQIKINGKKTQIAQQNLSFQNRLNYRSDDVKDAFLNSIANRIKYYLSDLKDKR